jgi:hypothetical protein
MEPLNQLLPAIGMTAVTAQSAEDVRFPPPVEIVLSCSAQEALTKVTQHAKASHGEAKSSARQAGFAVRSQRRGAVSTPVRCCLGQRTTDSDSLKFNPVSMLGTGRC